MTSWLRVSKGEWSENEQVLRYRDSPRMVASILYFMHAGIFLSENSGFLTIFWRMTNIFKISKKKFLWLFMIFTHILAKTYNEFKFKFLVESLTAHEINSYQVTLTTYHSRSENILYKWYNIIDYMLRSTNIFLQFSFDN